MQTKYHCLGKTINMTSQDIEIQSDNFNVDKNGNMSCSNANITNGNILLQSTDMTRAKLLITNPNNSAKIELTPGYINGYDASNNKTTTIATVLGFIRFDDGTDYSFMTPQNIVISNGITTTTISAEGIITPSVTQTSKEEDKKDFEKYNNALEIIKNIDIYKYHLKDENEEDKKHIGFVIGKDFKYSKEVTSKNNDGVDIYSFVSLCCQAIKEQQQKIEELEKRLEGK